MYHASCCFQSLYTDANSTYRVLVETFNKQLSLGDRISRVEVSLSLRSLQMLSTLITVFILHNQTQKLYLIAMFHSPTANFIRHMVT